MQNVELKRHSGLAIKCSLIIFVHGFFQQLRVTLELSQAELAIEREHLTKAVSLQLLHVSLQV